MKLTVITLAAAALIATAAQAQQSSPSTTRQINPTTGQTVPNPQAVQPQSEDEKPANSGSATGPRDRTTPKIMQEPRPNIR